MAWKTRHTITVVGLGCFIAGPAAGLAAWSWNPVLFFVSSGLILISVASLMTPGGDSESP